MTNKDLANRVDMDPRTVGKWKEEKPELYKLVLLGIATEEHLNNTESYLSNQKSLFKLSDLQIEITKDKTKKVTIAERIKVTPVTFFNWEKKKPELIKLINLGIASEKHIKSTEEYLEEIRAYF